MRWGQAMSIDPKLDLREMVREVLRDVIASRAAKAGTEAVTIATNADLQGFLARICAPGVIEALRAGTVKFSLAAAIIPAASEQGHRLQKPMDAAEVHSLDGVISERLLKDIATGSKVLLGANAVLTPLAKEAARRKGLTFERTAR